MTYEELHKSVSEISALTDNMILLTRKIVQHQVSGNLKKLNLPIGILNELKRELRGWDMNKMIWK